jgi:dienelactone hydrolase
LAFVLLWSLASAAAPHGAAANPAPQPVEIPEGGTTLHATLFRPDGPGPFAAVVALHGCEGLRNPNGSLRPRYQDWGQRLSGGGLVVLFPDSYGSRGLGPQCASRARQVRTDRERVADADAALHWLQAQAWVRPQRVSLLGWSSGATTTLWAVRRHPAVEDNRADFRSAVAFYPGCQRLADLAWSARVPTLVLIGRADDWSSAEACERMIAGARGRSAQARILVYPGAPHAFDDPNHPMQTRSGIAHSVDGSGRVHLGTNPSARADALARVPRWLAR